MSAWQLHISAWWWWASIMGAAVLTLGYLHLRRGGGQPRRLTLEILRATMVLLILLTLLRPERVREVEQETRPQVVVLTDHSGSMETVDMDGVSRREWLDSQVDSRFWEPLDGRYETAVEAFPRDPRAGTTNLYAALETVLQDYRELKVLILMSDGAWNEGVTPLAAAAGYSLRGVPIHALTVGRSRQLPDIALDRVRAPAFSLLNEQVSIPFRLVNHLAREVRTEVVLSSQGRQLAAKPVVLPAGGVVQDVMLWSARVLGEFPMELTVAVEEDEEIADNNSRRFRMAVRQERLSVLVVESRPRWEYRYLRNALSRDPGIEVDCLLLHPGLGRGAGEDFVDAFPDTRELLSTYDVIFLGDVGVGEGELSEDDLSLIRGVVEHLGSGLVLLPGPRGRQLSLAEGPLGDLLPITYDADRPAGIGLPQESQLQLTTLGEDHLLTMLTSSGPANRRLWRQLPGFFWCAPVYKARPGSDVLAVHSGRGNEWGRLPLLATRPFGQGNVLFMGTDSAWRWRKGVEDVYHYRFWGQVVRWMAHPRHLAQQEGIRLVFSPEAPRQGEAVALHANVMGVDGFPLSEGTVHATIEAPDGTTEHLELASVSGGWGVYEGRFTPEQDGLHALRVEAPSAGRNLTTRLEVDSYQTERVGDPANHEVLQELARATGGEVVGPDELEQLIESIRLLPAEEPRYRRFALWAQWWWGGLLVLILTGFWIMRKLAGLV